MENEYNYLIDPLSHEHAGWVFILIRQLYINKLPHLPMVIFSTKQIYNITQKDAYRCEKQSKVKLVHPICAMMHGSDVTFEVIADNAPQAFCYRAVEDEIRRIPRDEDSFREIKARLTPISSIAMTGLRYFNRTGRDKNITNFLQQIYNHANNLDASKQSLIRCMYYMINAILILSKQSQTIYYSLIRDSMNLNDFKKALTFRYPTIIDSKLIALCQQPFTDKHVLILIPKLHEIFEIQYDMQEWTDIIEKIKSFAGFERLARYYQKHLSNIYISKDYDEKRVKPGLIMPILGAIERYQAFSQLLTISLAIPEFNSLSKRLKNMTARYYQDLNDGNFKEILTQEWSRNIANWTKLLNQLVNRHERMNNYGLKYTDPCLVFVKHLNDASYEESLYLNAQLLAQSMEQHLFEHEVASFSTSLKI